MSDLFIKNCMLENGEKVDILILKGKIADISPFIQGVSESVPEIDAEGWLAIPPFLDSHFHLDATLSYGIPRINQSGTLLEGISLWGELKPSLKYDDLVERAENLCRWSIAKGTLGIRSHVDVSGKDLLGVEAMLHVREKFKDLIDIQLVAFPQDGLLRSNCLENLNNALDLGVDIVGGIPHFERTMVQGAESIKILCEIAEKRGLLVDMHCDESDDPMSRQIESLTYETVRLGLHGRVAGSHLTSMHSMDNYYFSKLLPLMQEANIGIIANPLINITLQGRHDSYPKRRGMTRIKEQINGRLKVAFGHDCVMDPWYPLGSHDMLEVASMALHVGHMTGQNEMKECFRAVTQYPAEIMCLDNYGLQKGCNGDLVILQATDTIEALRLKPSRLFVIRRGKIISFEKPKSSNVLINVETYKVGFSKKDFSWTQV